MSLDWGAKGQASNDSDFWTGRNTPPTQRSPIRCWPKACRAEHFKMGHFWPCLDMQQAGPWGRRDLGKRRRGQGDRKVRGPMKTWTVQGHEVCHPELLIFLCHMLISTLARELCGPRTVRPRVAAEAGGDRSRCQADPPHKVWMGTHQWSRGLGPLHRTPWGWPQGAEVGK